MIDIPFVTFAALQRYGFHDFFCLFDLLFSNFAWKGASMVSDLVIMTCI